MNTQHIRQDQAADATLAVRQALEQLQGVTGAKLVFEPGRYDFRPTHAGDYLLFPSNNDAGLKRVAFPLLDFQELEIDGQGAQFIFHGYMTPFALAGCRQVRLSHFSVDWARTFHSEGEILDVQPGSVDLLLPEAYPYRLEGDQIVFTGENSDVYPLHHALEFDPKRRETAFRAADVWGLEHRHRAQDLGERRVRLFCHFSTPPTVGNVLALTSGSRLCPGIFIAESRDIVLEDIRLHHTGGMGVIAQRSRDLRLTRVQVTPPPGSGRVVSLTADATHFVNCAGHILMEDCLFENQMDDPTNVHGVYTRVAERVSAREVEVQVVHPQQSGFVLAAPGEEVEFISNDTLAALGTASVQEVVRLNADYSRLTFAEALPDGVAAGSAAQNLTWSADLTIRGCTARGNRARGFLLSTPGRVLVENNHLHVPGAAILIEGDANYWFEAGAVRDITIRNNRFDNCLYGPWGSAVIQVSPGVKPEHRGEPRFHRNITVENNRFEVFDPRLVNAHSVDGFIFRHNEIVPSQEYPAQHQDSPAFSITDSSNTDIQ